MPKFSESWQLLPRLGVAVDDTPAPVRLRSQTMPARSKFVPHTHDWHQLTYATEGVLSVMIGNDCYVIAPGQALWIPKGVLHTTGSALGATLSSLYVDDIIAPATIKAFLVSNLLRALIVEVSSFDENTEKDYSNLVTELIIKQLKRMTPIQTALPWPNDGVTLKICEELYQNPTLERDAESWAEQFRMSKRTLARHFERETGLSMRVWTQKLRSIKALELLADGCNITQTSLSLGYSSTSAFTYMFRSEFGLSPSAYIKRP
ncbi:MULTISPECIES: helix-turn-helix domain-containing protein [unclassified Pseudomonas]|uniref:AraC family transcriptional regulator n=1 Tax=unclassified Pseudomonas TaxID=196821 RepID=UPI00148755F4|nr:MULTISPECIES: helix-turn-helix transcriptional regulator [unclassified Pseudomonas]